jgi:hypothetical protein
MCQPASRWPASYPLPRNFAVHSLLQRSENCPGKVFDLRCRWDTSFGRRGCCPVSFVRQPDSLHRKIRLSRYRELGYGSSVKTHILPRFFQAARSILTCDRSRFCFLVLILSLCLLLQQPMTPHSHIFHTLQTSRNLYAAGSAPNVSRDWIQSLDLSIQ